MDQYRIAFVMEQSLGHVTYARNLRRNVDDDPEIRAAWYQVEYDANDRFSRIPILGSNWSARASRQGRMLLKEAGAPDAFDAIFMHTQVTALFSAHLLRWGHGVVSLDATPRNYDAIGAAYGHRRGPAPLERLKDLVNRRAFHAARHLVTWCAWAKASLTRDYGVPPDRVTVIHPGTNLDLWDLPRGGAVSDRRVRLLFVGGDFRRKGGDLLLDVYRERLAGCCELDLVTSANVPAPPPGARVHSGIAPNSAALRRLFAEADVFVLPTRADCLALVLMEAMAARLPIVTTNVGALSEAVHDGANGFLVPPDRGDALAEAILRLVADPALRRRMAVRGYEMAGEAFDARRNTRTLLALLKEHAATANSDRSAPPRAVQPR